MVGNMAKEISSELSLLNLNLSPDTMSLDQLYKLLAIASISIPEKVQTDYLRGEGISTVKADVLVKGNAEGLALQATVSVILKYKGDMVRTSFTAKNKIKLRLQKLAQQYCAEEAYKVIVNSSLK